MKIFRHGLLVILLLSLVRVGLADDFERLTRQYQNYIMQRSGANRRVSPNRGQSALQLARTLRADGSWADVDYSDQTRGGWLPYSHIAHIYAMVRAYKGSENKGQPELQSAIHKALGYWLEKDYRCSNWWYNTIGVPQTVGEIAILMGPELTPPEYDWIMNKCLPRGKIGMTGQNRVWVAGITLTRGLLAKDEKLVKEAAGVIGEEIRLTTDEGVQPDYSFHQHGPQLQFGNYGLSFAGDTSKWLRVFTGTPFEFPREKVDIIHDYLMRGESWVVWQGRMDISSCGRQLGMGAQTGKGRTVAHAMAMMRQVDFQRAADYEAFIKRNTAGNANDLVGNRHFWRSDFMVQREADYYASVKMASRRVVGGELVNNENVSGYHMADGALYLYRSGEEYEDIQPVWDWQKLPGTTCAQDSQGPPRLRKRYSIESDFVGGVSDGQRGCAALDYVRDGVRARKAWFFLEGAIVCLGAGIQSEGALPVVTTVNQCWLRGDVIVGAGGRVMSLTQGGEIPDAPRWAWHDGVGYLFLQGGKVMLQAQEQRGSWRKVEEKNSISQREVKGNVFSACYQHGVGPRQAAYAYMMMPGVKAESMNEKANRPEMAILENSTRMQAVRTANSQLVQAVFYEAGEMKSEKITIIAAQPCLVMADMRSGTLTVCDPTQKLEGLSLTVNGKKHEVRLPRGSEAGRSVSVKM